MTTHLAVVCFIASIYRTPTAQQSRVLAIEVNFNYNLGNFTSN